MHADSHAAATTNEANLVKLVHYRKINYVHLTEDKGELLFQDHFGSGPLTASLSPGFREWIYFETLPVSYFLMINVNSPSKSDGDMGV